MKSKNLMMCGVFAFASACTSPDKVKEIDTTLDAKGKVNDGDVGLNDEGVAIIQKQTSADLELRSQEMVNYNLQERLNSEHFALKSCRTDLSDPRLGGNGNVAPIPDVDGMRQTTEVAEELGLTSDGGLKVVQKQSFSAKLASERKYQASLEKMLKLVTDHRERCDRQLGHVRTQHGLTPEPKRSAGYFTADGTWVETNAGERSLNDAFEIQAREKAKAHDKSNAPSPSH